MERRLAPGPNDMSASVGRHERVAKDHGDVMDDIGETATLLSEEGVADPGVRAVEPQARAGLAEAGVAGPPVRIESSADPIGRAECSADRAGQDRVSPTGEEPADLAAHDEGSTDRVGLTHEDSAREDSVDVGTGVGTQTAAQMAQMADDKVFAVERARVVEALFQVPAHPQMLGRYVVLRTLGKGGMGTVLEAFDRTLERKVAVKVLHEDLGGRHTARLLREAQAMAKLSHPNVVPVFEAGMINGQTFVAMERVQGQTLRDWMRQDPRPDWRQCVKVFIEAGQGLAAAHAQGLIHRDFKPSNAIVDDEGRARVLDFGLVRWSEAEPTGDGGLGRAKDEAKGEAPVGAPAPQGAATRTKGARMMGAQTIRARDHDQPALDQALTRTGAVVGTPAYMPPEQMLGRLVDARSDQFSFCVALYEAVYGQRPFEGRSVAALMAAVTSSEVQPAPKGSRVPARLRAVLLRGLAADPMKRWPSMEALLAQLHTLVAPRTRRWVAWGLSAGLAALGGGLALPQVLKMQDRCTGAPAQMDGLWDNARRQQVQAAILGTEVSFAPGTWDRIEPQLDAYAQAWMDTHTAACEATRVRGDQTPEEMSLRMRCLDRRRTTLRATVDVLADADAEIVTNAVKLVADLPSLTRCDDLAWLEQHNQRIPPPEDPDVAAAVEAQRARLADIEAMEKAGRYADALGEVELIVQQAEALGYPPLRAEALYWRGRLREDNGQYAEAEPDLRQAHMLAVTHHHDSVALHAAQALTFVVGCKLVRHAEGQQWGEIDSLPLAQRSGDPLHEAGSLNSLGSVFACQGDYEQARIHHQRALAIRDRVLGADHPELATSLGNLGGVLFRQGYDEDARFYLEQALEIREKTLGPDHPDVATSLDNLGDVLFRQGYHEDARVSFQQALATRERALGSDHPAVAGSLNNLANVFSSQGYHEEAQVHCERALTILKKALGNDHPELANTLNNLGLVLARQGELDKARAHIERALAILKKALGNDHPELADTLNNLGLVLTRQGEPDKAWVHYERAIEILTKTLGPDHPDVAMSLNKLGLAFFRQGNPWLALRSHSKAVVILEQALGPNHPELASPNVGVAAAFLETGDPESALEYAERAVAIREATTVAPLLLAEARFILAQALWSTQFDRTRARALAEQARDALAAAEGPGHSEVDLADVDTWLATHRVE